MVKIPPQFDTGKYKGKTYLLRMVQQTANRKSIVINLDFPELYSTLISMFQEKHYF